MPRLPRPLVMLALLSAWLAWDAYECGVPAVVTVSSAVRDLDPALALRIVQLSDVHDASFFGGDEPLWEAIRAFKPDAIMLSGDYVDGQTKDLARPLARAATLMTLAPRVFYAPGNHDHWSGRLDALAAGLAARGVTVLRNRSATWDVRGVRVHVVGIDDGYTRHDDVARAVAGVPPAACALALTHDPTVVDRLGDAPIDFVLAGHTHGGQVRVPFVGALWAPGQGLFPRYDRGFYDLPMGRRMYVDSGLGTSIMPVRAFDRAQISLLTLSPAAGSAQSGN